MRTLEEMLRELTDYHNKALTVKKELENSSLTERPIKLQENEIWKLKTISKNLEIKQEAISYIIANYNLINKEKLEILKEIDKYVNFEQPYKVILNLIEKSI